MEVLTQKQAAQLVKDFALITSLWDVEEARHATNAVRVTYESIYSQRKYAACKGNEDENLGYWPITESIAITQALHNLQKFLLLVKKTHNMDDLFQKLEHYKEEASCKESTWTKAWWILGIDPQSGYQSLIEMGKMWLKYMSYTGQSEYFNLTNWHDLRRLDRAIRIISSNDIFAEGMKLLPLVNLSVTWGKRNPYSAAYDFGDEHISSMVDAERLDRFCASVPVKDLKLIVDETIGGMLSTAWVPFGSMWSAGNTVESLTIIGKTNTSGGEVNIPKGCFKNIDKLQKIKGLDLRSVDLDDSDVDSLFQLIENRGTIHTLTFDNVKWTRMRPQTLEKHRDYFRQRNIRVFAAKCVFNRSGSNGNTSIDLLSSIPIEEMHIIVHGYTSLDTLENDIRHIIQNNPAVRKMSVDCSDFSKEQLDDKFVSNVDFQAFLQEQRPRLQEFTIKSLRR